MTIFGEDNVINVGPVFGPEGRHRLFTMLQHIYAEIEDRESRNPRDEAISILLDQMERGERILAAIDQAESRCAEEVTQDEPPQGWWV